jgi:hypothetical protein
VTHGYKSALGAQLERAEVYSTDSHGRPIPARPAGWGFTSGQVAVKASHPSPPPPLSSQLDDGSEQAAIAFARLTDEERLVMLWLEAPPVAAPLVRHRRQVKLGNVVSYLRRGYVLVPGSDTDETVAGVAVTFVRVEGVERSTWTYEAIGERLGLSADAVYRRARSARRKLAGR